jgi:hypothetical protein
MLSHRGQIFALIKKSLSFAPISHTLNPGQSKKYRDELIEGMYQVGYLLRYPLRQICGLYEEYVKQHDLNIDIPNYTTLSRRLKAFHIGITKNTKLKGARDIAVDSSTFRIYDNTNTHARRNKPIRKCFRYEQCRKLHVSLDIQSKEVVSAIYTSGTYTDHQGLALVVNQASPQYTIGTLCADRAYDRKPCHQACLEKGIVSIIPPTRLAIEKTGAIFQRRNEHIRFIRAHKDYEIGLMFWKRQHGYGRRAYIESFFGRFKKIFGQHLRSRSESNRKNEMLIKCNLMNRFTRMGMPRFELA